MSGVFATFYHQPVEMPYKSEQAQRPIFEDQEFVKVFIAGDRNTEVVRPALPEDKLKWPEEYRRFQDGLRDQAQIVGTPLTEWPRMSASMVREFNAQNLYTVEHVAAMSDTIKQKIGMGANEIAAQARAYLEAASGTADVSSLAAENSRMKDELETLKAQMVELMRRAPVAEAEDSPVKRGPGRPPRIAKDDALS